jgi:SAM-dependent methyltransferase
MSENHFGEAVAERYDESSSAMFSPEVLDPAVDVLAELARPAHGGGTGRALELAIGTGRVALPLAGRGVRVHGIELSDAMLARLRTKAGSATIGTTLGDMTSTAVEGTFELVYLVFNTIGNVTTQDGQVAVFRNAAAHLAPLGRFVVELQVPQLQRIPPGERFHVFSRTEHHVGIDEYDVATQRMWSHHTPSTPTVAPGPPCRSATPGPPSSA